MNWFLGLDSSTQSLSAMIIDTDSGEIAAEASVNFGDDLPQYRCPQGFLEHTDPLVKHSDPLVWTAAVDLLFTRLTENGVDLSAVRGISGSGQQHGTVYLNASFLAPSSWNVSAGLADMVLPMLSRATAPIWMDSSTSGECAEIAAAAGGAEEVLARSGSHTIERFSGPQIRKFYQDDAAAYENTAVVHLVSSFLGSLLVGKSIGIDLGDGAGMNLLNLATGAWDPVLLEATAPGLSARLPAPVASSAKVGEIAAYFVERYGFSAGTPVTAWSGDNPNSLIGVGGWQPGVAVVSLGTSDTYFAAMIRPTTDPNGCGHVFGNPAGGFMSLICFKNGSLAREKVKDAHGLSWQDFDVASLASTPPGNNGNMMLPYFVPEITPVVLDASPKYRGSAAFVNGEDAAAAVRAVVEAQAMSLKLHSGWIEDSPSVIRVTGGAAASTGICQILANVFEARVERLETGNSAALGAAMRAANGAAGMGWGALAQTFSKPVGGMDVLPEPENVPVYQEMMPTFAAFVEEKGRGLGKC